MIKGQDLILAKGYFQSNRGRWRTSGRFTMLNRVVAAWCGRRGQSSTLHGYGAMFSVGFLPTKLAGCEELTKGVFNRRGASEQDARRQGSGFNL
jgi:hypothetical protein